MIPYGRQHISDDDIQAVVQVLRSDFLTQGPMVPQFEQAVAGYCGAAHAVAVNSATSALHIACLALGVGHGDRVWTSPITFLASANCARYCGASVDFVDIDPMTYNMCPQQLAVKLIQAEKSGLLPKVVIPVHFAGQPCDMASIHSLAQRYGFKIIEDAAHAIGARYRGSIIGDCAYSDIAVFSFHPVKIITTAEGGIAATRSGELARRMMLLRSHGMTRELNELENVDEGPWYYEQQLLGFNYRMTDVQAVLGLSQMKLLNSFLAQRRHLAKRYETLLADLPATRPVVEAGNESAWHLYSIRINAARRRAVFDKMRSNGIGVNVHYIPVHTQPYYRELGFSWGNFPEAERYYREALTLPLFADLAEDEQAYVAATLRETLPT